MNAQLIHSELGCSCIPEECYHVETTFLSFFSLRSVMLKHSFVWPKPLPM